MSYRIRQTTWDTAERYCMLVDAETGMPPWYPMLFITTQLRNDGQSVATMEAALGTIQVLLDFTEARGPAPAALPAMKFDSPPSR